MAYQAYGKGEHGHANLQRPRRAAVQIPHLYQSRPRATGKYWLIVYQAYCQGEYR